MIKYGYELVFRSHVKKVLYWDGIQVEHIFFVDFIFSDVMSVILLRIDYLKFKFWTGLMNKQEWNIEAGRGPAKLW